MKKEEIIEIRPIEIQKTTIRIVGDTPLIMHAWSEKAKREILEKQMKTTKSKAKQAMNPVEDFIRSMYWLTPMPTEMTQEAFEAAIDAGARFGFPVTAFKQAAISAAYRMGWTKDKMTMRGAFFIDGDENQMIRICSDTPIMREDMARIGMGTADIRYHRLREAPGEPRQLLGNDLFDSGILKTNGVQHSACSLCNADTFVSYSGLYRKSF